MINGNVTGMELPFRAPAVLTTSNLLTVLGQPPMLGRDFKEQDAGRNSRNPSPHRP